MDIVDEIHAHKNRAVWDALGTAKISQAATGKWEDLKTKPCWIGVDIGEVDHQRIEDDLAAALKKRG